MDNSTFQMFTVGYHGVLNEETNALLIILLFGLEFRGLGNAGYLTAFHGGEVEVIRIKSTGGVTIRWEERDVLSLEELIGINVPKLEG